MTLTPSGCTRARAVLRRTARTGHRSALGRPDGGAGRHGRARSALRPIARRPAGRRRLPRPAVPPGLGTRSRTAGRRPADGWVVARRRRAGRLALERPPRPGRPRSGAGRGRAAAHRAGAGRHAAGRSAGTGRRTGSRADAAALLRDWSALDLLGTPDWYSSPAAPSRPGRHRPTRPGRRRRVGPGPLGAGRAPRPVRAGGPRLRPPTPGRSTPPCGRARGRRIRRLPSAAELSGRPGWSGPTRPAAVGPCRPDGTVLVTGGTGGLGRAARPAPGHRRTAYGTCCWPAGAGRPRGRPSCVERAAPTRRRRPPSRACDVADRDALAAVLPASGRRTR